MHTGYMDIMPIAPEGGTPIPSDHLIPSDPAPVAVFAHDSKRAIRVTDRRFAEAIDVSGFQPCVCAHRDTPLTRSCDETAVAVRAVCLAIGWGEGGVGVGGGGGFLFKVLIASC